MTKPTKPTKQTKPTNPTPGERRNAVRRLRTAWLNAAIGADRVFAVVDDARNQLVDRDVAVATSRAVVSKRAHLVWMGAQALEAATHLVTDARQRAPLAACAKALGALAEELEDEMPRRRQRRPDKRRRR